MGVGRASVREERVGLRLIVGVVVALMVAGFGGAAYWTDVSLPRSVAAAFGTSVEVPPHDAKIDVTVWMPEHVDWERSFIVQDLIAAAAGGTVTVRVHNEIADFDRERRDLRINESNAVNVVVFHGRFEDDKKCRTAIIEKVQYYQPAVVFLTSDEQAWTRCVNSKLAQMVPIVFRHYAFQSHSMDYRPNVFNIPLGTMNGQVFPNSTTLIKASQREWVWGFAGASKHDRQALISSFQNAFPNRYKAVIDANPSIPMTEVADIYSRSVFVPNARGFVSLDCFRLYEASRAGAIPVMLAPLDDAERTFGHFLGSDGTMPPWIFSSDAGDAARQAADLLKSPAALDARQAAVLSWWQNVTAAIVKKTRSALLADYARRKASRRLHDEFMRRGDHESANWFVAHLPLLTPTPPTPPPPPPAPSSTEDPMATLLPDDPHVRVSALLLDRAPGVRQRKPRRGNGGGASS